MRLPPEIIVVPCPPSVTGLDDGTAADPRAPIRRFIRQGMAIAILNWLGIWLLWSLSEGAPAAVRARPSQLMPLLMIGASLPFFLSAFMLTDFPRRRVSPW